MPTPEKRPPRADPDRLARAAFLAACLASAMIAAFVYGLIAHREGLWPAPTLLELAYRFDEGSLFSGPEGYRVQPARGPGAGVTVNAAPQDGALILMLGYFENENQARLIRRDGELVRKWRLDYLEHFPDPQTRPCEIDDPLGVDMHGVVLSPTGELTFNYEYCGTVRLDACGGVLWTLPALTHHSIVPAAGGGYWALGRFVWNAGDSPDRFAPFSQAADPRADILEDTLMRISSDGAVLEERSLPELMRDAGLEALLTANGVTFEPTSTPRTELVHANKVTELSAEIADAFPLFAAGDLAISMRQLNLVMVIDPRSRRVKWSRTGPWLRQHDPEFRPDGRISIFNNNVYLTAYENDQTAPDAEFATNIIAVDPVSGATEVLFGERPGEEMLSVIRGQHELLANGGMLITEFDGGRVLEVNARREIVWEYVNRLDDAFVGEVTNAMLYDKDHFTRDWSACPG